MPVLNYTLFLANANEASVLIVDASGDALLGVVPYGADSFAVPANTAVAEGVTNLLVYATNAAGLW